MRAVYKCVSELENNGFEANWVSAPAPVGNDICLSHLYFTEQVRKLNYSLNRIKQKIY